MTTAPTLRAEPSPPADTFYSPPAGWESTRPGEILKSRPVAVKALQMFPINVTGWQLLYRTTGRNGEPDAAVTTVMVPRGPTKPRPLLSYQAATDSTLRVCNPSYSLIRGFWLDPSLQPGPLTFALPSAEIALAAAGLEQGWAVAMPDHGGINNQFFTPRQPGFATLDGIRAAQKFRPLGLDGVRTPVGLWGYSGGAIASSWAAEEHPTYAPELRITGLAMGAPERDPIASLKAVNGTPLAGLIPLVLGAVLKDEPHLAPVLRRYITPAGMALIQRTRNHCVGQNAMVNLWFNYKPYLTAPLDVVLNDPRLKPAFDSRGISGKHPTAPVYIYNGVTEEVGPISGADKLARSYCRGTTPITYRREELPPRPIPLVMSTHSVIAATGAPGAFAWLKTRMNTPTATPAGCDTKTVPNTLLTPEALSVLGPSFIGNALLAAIGYPIGHRP